MQPVRFRLLLVFIPVSALFALALILPASAQDRLGKDKALYAQETDPVRKAKLLGEMGPLEIDQARITFKSGSDEQALDILMQYDDQVQKTLEALIAAQPNAVKKPAGFKELQIGLRVSLRRLDDLILAIPVDKRPWFRTVRMNLSDAQNKLIDALFQTGEKPAGRENAGKNDGGKEAGEEHNQQP